MKKHYGFLSLAAGAALLLAGGCSKQESVTPAADNTSRAEAPTPAAAQPVKEAVKAELTTVAVTASNVANSAVSGAKQAVADSLQTATNQVQAAVAAVKPEATAATLITAATNAINSAVGSAQQALVQKLAASSSLPGLTNQVQAAVPTDKPQATASTLVTKTTNAVSSAVSSAEQALLQKFAPAPSLAGVTNPAPTVAATGTNQVQSLLEKAKGLTSNQKYQDALKVIQQLSAIQLTPEQQQLVTDLKGQIQTALAKQAGTNALSALGSILGGKK